MFYRATSSGTEVRTIVSLVPTEQGRYRLKLPHLNFDPYPSRTREGLWVNLVPTDTQQRACLNFETMEMIECL